MIKNLLFVGIGGGLGSICRYAFQRWASYFYPHSFPWGTFTVNMIGCLAIGIIWGLAIRSFDGNEQLKLLLMTWFCGGFTTFSAFTLEGIGLIREHKLFLFFSYIVASVTIGLLFTYAGMKLIR